MVEDDRPPDPQPRDDEGTTDTDVGRDAEVRSELRYWSEQSRALHRSQMESIRTSASRVQALTLGLLGVFSLAAYAGGLDLINDLPSSEAGLIKLSTLAIALLLVASTVLLHQAGVGLRVRTLDPIYGPDLKDLYDDQLRVRARLLRVGSAVSLVGVLLLLTGSAVILWQDPNPSSVIATVGGRVVCGDLARDGARLVVDGEALDGRVTSIVPVARCPEPAPSTGATR